MPITDVPVEARLPPLGAGDSVAATAAAVEDEDVGDAEPLGRAPPEDEPPEDERPLEPPVGSPVEASRTATGSRWASRRRPPDRRRRCT
jgi:hypothetical protein